MKTATTLLAASALALAAATVQAGPREDAAVAACGEALMQFYGAEAEVRLVQSRRVRGATQLRLATIVDPDHSPFTDCRIDADGVAILDRGDLDQLVAAAQPTAPKRR